jgi:hypothetical protein
MRAPDQHWAALVALLPMGTDQAWFRGELERIRDTTREALVAERQHCRERERFWQSFVTNDLPEVQLPDKDAVAARLLERAEAFKQRADFLAQHEPKWKWWRLIELCALAERVGIDLHYTTPRKGPPHGSGICYVMSVSELIGQSVGEHYAREILKYFAHMKMASAVLVGEGTLTARLGQVRPLANNAGVVILD